MISVFQAMVLKRPPMDQLAPTTPIDPVKRARLGEDLFGSHADVVAAAGRRVGHAGHHWFGASDSAHFHMRSLASAGAPGLSTARRLL